MIFSEMIPEDYSSVLQILRIQSNNRIGIISHTIPPGIHQNTFIRLLLEIHPGISTGIPSENLPGISEISQAIYSDIIPGLLPGIPPNVSPRVLP